MSSTIKLVIDMGENKTIQKEKKTGEWNENCMETSSIFIYNFFVNYCKKKQLTPHLSTLLPHVSFSPGTGR